MRPATFSGPSRYAADTCAPLEAAVARGSVQMRALARGTYPGDRLRGLPGVRTVGFWDAARAQTWGLDWHRNEGIELMWLEQGSLAFATEDVDVLLRPGDLTITRPWQRHRVGAPHVTPGRLHWLILDVGVRRPDQPWRWPAWVRGMTELARLTELLRHNEHPVWPGDGAVGEAFVRLGAAVEARRERWVGLRICELLLAVGELLEAREPALDASLSSTERAVAVFLESLRERAGEPWTLDAMAAECGLRRTRFTHYCTRLTNMTPGEYLSWVRVERASELLATTDAPMTEIALVTGFGSSQYFATAFRRVRGCTPSEARESSAVA